VNPATVRGAFCTGLAFAKVQQTFSLQLNLAQKVGKKKRRVKKDVMLLSVAKSEVLAKMLPFALPLKHT